MIGFTVQGKVYDEDGEVEWSTFILSMDVDAVENDGKPALDIRMAGNDALIGNLDIKDVYDAMYEIHSQLGAWERTQTKDGER